MLGTLLVILFILWVLGYFTIPGLAIPNIVLFSINNHPITLWAILTLIVVSWLVGILPSPLREIAGVLVLLWILSMLGILAVGGLPSIIIIVIIVGLALYLIRGAF